MDGRPVRGILGVMTVENEGFPPIGERDFSAKLCRAGRTLGLQVYVFDPRWTVEDGHAVRGYALGSDGAWEAGRFPLPDWIYDRTFPVSREDWQRQRDALRSLRSIRPIPILNPQLGDKNTVLHLLRQDSELARFVPRTELLDAPTDVFARLRSEQRLFLKPANGSQGRRTAAIACSERGFEVKWRDGANRPHAVLWRSVGQLTEWVRRFTAGRAYLVQPFLELQTTGGLPWDIRSLVQKNGQGQWQLTGMAVRLGAAGSMTSNLHGGGDAQPVERFLRDQFGAMRSLELMEELRLLSRRIPIVLEAARGRQAELGLDLGVDRQGRTWIIEANTKPGRTVFQRLGDSDASRRSVENPVAYALYLIERSQATARPYLPQPAGGPARGGASRLRPQNA